MNQNGYGRCQKAASNFGGLPICYVRQPSNCTDLKNSTTDQGKQLSALACARGREMVQND